MTPVNRDREPVKLYAGCFGITWGGDGAPQEVHQIELVPGQGFVVMVPGWTFFLDEDGSCPGAESWSIIAVFPDRASAEDALARDREPLSGAPGWRPIETAPPSSTRMPPMDLNEAIAELQGKGDWFADEFEDFDERLRSPLATILNAAASGQLIPLETCNAVEALRMERDRFESALSRACLVGGTTYLVERAEKAEAEAEAAETALAAMTARNEALVGALGRANRALKPFADRVFNDNGDCTISDTHALTPADYWNAQIAERVSSDALSADAAKA